MLVKWLGAGERSSNTPHICWKEAKNIIEGNFIVDHLRLELGSGQLARVLMRPSMAGNLVAFLDHALAKYVSIDHS